MRTLDRRIRKLEDRFGTSDRKLPRILVFLYYAGWLALDEDRCIQILDECGFLPKGIIDIVDFGKIPEGLDAKDLERFLRKSGAELTGFRGAPDHDGHQEQASTQLHGCSPSPNPDDQGGQERWS